jgi:hypothetical protein
VGGALRGFQERAHRQTQGEEHMSKGLLDDIPIYNTARDKAWEAFIKRKDVKHLVEHGVFDKGFPLYGGYYELWCQAWDRAWTAGFKDGHDSGQKWAELMNNKLKGAK